ncbi:helix-turn-helix domain-containing protein [Dokdonia sp. 4H-3-7-5]|uniref:helix-turn-helix domain-containing protein n=1 Tax=Dokdonia sp. (strain 4H-3-7-5) TaxID=983548 RepID=UPI00020A6F61|nr:AraC family transcriptional regulator [Dokdonia sp. 4H-3-7-5]AEE19122.1 transcriptional regulator, AraC family [Dokdonia sp. 4H-3-7-5]
MVKDFYIKNMVCDRCIKVLKDELFKANISLLDIELGRLRLDMNEKEQLSILTEILKRNGFALIASTEDKLTEQVKIELIKLLNVMPLDIDGKLSDFLADKLQKDYSKISKVFSITEGITIEKYFIKLKIEKVKELIQTPDYNFTEISQLLDYSNVNHLSKQFKSETGMSLSDYKDGHKNFRNPLDKII